MAPITAGTESPPGDDSERQLLAAVLTVVEHARHRIALYASVLPPLPFASAAFGRVLTQFVLAHRHNEAHFLIDDATQAVRDNERLVALGRRLSDRVQWRQLAADDREAPDCFLINDAAGGVRLVEPATSRMEWIDTVAARELHTRFDRLWQRAAPLPALHPLGL